MPFNGAGQFTPSAADNPVIASTLIQSTKFNNTINDVATGLSTCLTKDGQQIATANQPMGGFRHTNVANASNRNEYAAVGQVQDQGFTWVGTFGGTADALTLTPTPAITAYLAGQSFVGKASATNATTTPTASVSSLPTKTIQNNGAALAAGDIVNGKWYRLTYDGVTFQLEQLRNANSFLDGANFSLKNVADPTKVVQFDASGVPAATTVSAKFAAAGVVEGQQGANITSAGTVNLDTATGNYAHITGTTTITAVTLAQGRERTVVFDGILTLTNGASLILPGGANITTAAGDVAVFRGEAAGVVRCISYIRSLFGKVPTTQVFTASGTYTPPAGLVWAKVRLQAPGGGSGGCAATAGAQVAGAGGGGGGGYSERRLTAAQIGASQTVTIGAVGAAGTAGNNVGGTGGTTSLGALLSATGGVGGSGGINSAATVLSPGGAGGTGSSGDVNTVGGGGGFGVGLIGSFTSAGGLGGSSALGGGGASNQTAATTAGNAGNNYGGGASGSALGQSQAATAGAAGGPGIIVVEEFYN